MPIHTMEITQKGLIRAIILAIACALVLRIFVADIMIIQGRSMFPTLRSGSLIVVHKSAYGVRLPIAGRYLVRWSLPSVGDCVVFYTPFGERAVKRVYAITAEGNIFVRGDNPAESLDSRYYGAISPDRIVGRVVQLKRGIVHEVVFYGGTRDREFL